MIAKITQWIGKQCAKVACNYLSTVALWAIRLGASKAGDDEKTKFVLCVITDIAENAALISKAMSDGVVSEEEALAIKVRTDEIATKLQSLL